MIGDTVLFFSDAACAPVSPLGQVHWGALDINTKAVLIHPTFTELFDFMKISSVPKSKTQIGSFSEHIVRTGNNIKKLQMFDFSCQRKEKESKIMIVNTGCVYTRN